MKTYRRGIAPHSLNLNTRWKWIISSMPQPLSPQRKILWYPLAGRPQSWSGQGAKDSKIGKLWYLEYTDVPEVFFKPHNIGLCCTNAIWGHCWVTMTLGPCYTDVVWCHCYAIVCSNTDLHSHCCTTLCYNNRTMVPMVAQQWRWSHSLPTS
jgi:hypothetical protein